MPEIAFVIKSIFIAVLVMIGLQYKIGNTTLEQRAHAWIQTSSTALYLQQVASGAVLAIRNASGMATGFVSKTFNSDFSTQKASRLNLEFKRSQQYQETRSENEE